MKDNKLIAEFMGFKPNEHGIYQTKHGPYYLDSLSFHTSWDWLMPVVGKMNKTELWEEYSKGELLIALVSYDRDSAYGLIVEFIKTHNENK